MSFSIEHLAARNSSFVTPGESFLVLASAASLRKHLSDSYWCEAMEEVCDGRLQGVAVRYTGDNLVMVQFRPHRLSPAGYRYPLFMSIPVDFLVPESLSAVSMAGPSELQGSFGTATTSSHRSNASSHCDAPLRYASSRYASPKGTPPATSALPKLCVVCGRYNVPGMVSRRHGWKCKVCKGKHSSAKMREAAQRLQAQLQPEC